VKTLVLSLVAFDAILVLSILLQPIGTRFGHPADRRRRDRARRGWARLADSGRSLASDVSTLLPTVKHPRARHLGLLADELDKAGPASPDRPQESYRHLAPRLVVLSNALAADIRVGWPWSRRRLRHAREACRVLGHLPVPQALGPLLQAAHASDTTLARQALAALGRGASVFGGAAVSLAALVREGPPVTRPFARWALQRVVVSNPPLLRGLITDPSEQVRRTLLHALPAAHDDAEMAGAHEEASALLATAHDALADRSPEVREDACRALGQIPSVTPQPWLERALADESSRVQRTAVQFVAGTGDPSVLPRLVSWLEFADAETRQFLVRAIQRIAVLPIDFLLEQACSGPLPSRLAAMRAVATSRHSDVASGLAPLLSDDDATVRREAALAIAANFRSRFPHPGDPRAVDHLLFRFEVEANEGTRLALAEALDYSGDRRVPKALTDAMTSAPGPTRERLVEGLAVFDRLARLTARAGAPRDSQEQPA
jgi:HEAT repeat protein